MKLRKKVIICLATIIISTTMQAQQSFGSYMNNLFFNVFSETPDSSMQKFLSDFVPILLHPPEDSGKWTTYPIGEIPHLVTIAHSYFFSKHPLIDADIKQGEFKVYTNVYENLINPGITGIKDIQVIMEFEKLDDATKFFEKTRTDLVKLAEEETYCEDTFRRFSKIYSAEVMYSIPCGVRIHLVTERDINNLYQVIIGIN